MTRHLFGLFLLASAAIACSSNDNNGATGTGGTTGNAGTTGSGGSSAGGTGGTSAGGTGGTTGSGGTGGGTAGFMSIAPCPAESDYMTGTTVSFGGTVGFFYEPKCLKIAAGSSVTFSGDFSFHPLAPSAARGNTTNNPIPNISALPDGGTTTSIMFPNRGFYAYLCSFHGSDDGMFMSGVVWVQ